jgi:hypothetical protein
LLEAFGNENRREVRNPCKKDEMGRICSTNGGEEECI